MADAAAPVFQFTFRPKPQRRRPNPFREAGQAPANRLQVARDGLEGAAAKQTTTVCATTQRVMSNGCVM